MLDAEGNRTIARDTQLLHCRSNALDIVESFRPFVTTERQVIGKLIRLFETTVLR